jgi:NADH-quinone oxidoreductase subunit M
MADFFQEWILSLLILVPLAGALVIAMLRGPNGSVTEAARVRGTALAFSGVTFVLTLLAVSLFYQATDDRGRSLAERGELALVQDLSWVSDAELAGPTSPGTRYVDLRYHVGVDGLSIWLIVLTAGITPLAIWGSFSGIRQRVQEYYLLMLLLEAGMIGVFCARDLLLFYVFFEFTLIPLFFIIGIWGGPQRREASAKFFIYTMAGSVLTFGGILYLAYQAYALPASRGGVGVFTFDLATLYGLDLSPGVQWWVFLALAAGFMIKVPLFPFHTWLPLAHTEAPTAGSVLLAGVLLKLGTYGFLRFSIPMLPSATMVFAPVMAGLAIAGIIYAALVAWVQDDIKKLVAYSSVSHLGFCILGMFSLKEAGVSGSLLYMINHGLSTGALFLVVGMIYERYHTRHFGDLGGLARPMPWMAFFLIVFTLSSIGLPGLNGFVGEFLVLLGTFTSGQHTPTSEMGPLGVAYGVIATSGVLLGAIYMLYMCRRVLFGPVREPAGTPDTSHGLSRDLTPREIGILAPIALVCLAIGVRPNLILDTVQPAARRQVLQHVFDEPREVPGDLYEYAGDAPRGPEFLPWIPEHPVVKVPGAQVLSALEDRGDVVSDAGRGDVPRGTVAWTRRPDRGVLDNEIVVGGGTEGVRP